VVGDGFFVKTAWKKSEKKSINFTVKERQDEKGTAQKKGKKNKKKNLQVSPRAP